MSSESEVIRRTRTTKKKVARNSIDIENGDSSKTGHGRRHHSERPLRIVSSMIASALLIVSLLACIGVFFLSPEKENDGIHNERFFRAKALRDAIKKTTKRHKNKRKEEALDTQSNHENNMITFESLHGMRYLDPRQLPPLPGEPDENYYGKQNRKGFSGIGDDEWLPQSNAFTQPIGPKVDYTKHKYQYPELVLNPSNDGTYPHLEPMLNVFRSWEQDDLDTPPETIVEVLQHFDYQDPQQLEAAVKYRDLELPFKVYNVPEVIAAGLKWTDEYVASHFDGGAADDTPQSQGLCQQSIDHFFAFHRPQSWDVSLLGDPPSLDLNWTYEKWARHAVYADEVRLPINHKHYYWQSGVPRGERLLPKSQWTFVSKDLPSFSNPKRTFFGFHPEQQKGIQCRFGERGVTAATHYDGGRNMIAMMVGAKRYILSPPSACPKLGVVTSRNHPSYRHSMLNFGRVTLPDATGATTVKMSEREKEWLKISGTAPTLSTVLKAGEVLYVPSHWFHYIISLQKSAQCNTRSGIHAAGNVHFGGLDDVTKCIGA